jgi:hypothetical protein
VLTREAIRVELISGGNVIKQGDETTLVFQFRHESGNVLDLQGSKIKVTMANSRVVVLEKDAVVNTDNTVSFPLTQKDVTGWGEMRIEFTITYQGGTIRKLPADGWLKINITKTLDDVEVGGVSYVTVETMKSQFQRQIDVFSTSLDSRVTTTEGKAITAETNAVQAYNTATSIQNQFNQVIQRETDSNAESAQARIDTEGVAHPTLKARVDYEITQTTERFNQSIAAINKEKASVQELDRNRTIGVPVTAGAPVFARNATRDYKGRTYQINEPVYDQGGVLVEPEIGETLKIPTSDVLNHHEGTIEGEITPLAMIDFMNYCRIDFPTGGRFAIFCNAAGGVRFAIAPFGGAFIGTSDGVVKLNEPFSFALRWNHRAMEYSLFVNGKREATGMYDKNLLGAFGTEMNVVYNYKAIVHRLRFSKVARRDRELIY